MGNFDDGEGHNIFIITTRVLRLAPLASTPPLSPPAGPGSLYPVPNSPTVSRLPHPDASVGRQVAPLRGVGPVTAHPPSPPLRSHSSRGTPRSATSDRGGSSRLPGAHGSPFSAGPALPAGSPVADSDPTPPLSCLRGAAITRQTS